MHGADHLNLFVTAYSMDLSDNAGLYERPAMIPFYETYCQKSVFTSNGDSRMAATIIASP
jgi:hypothetical protein